MGDGILGLTHYFMVLAFRWLRPAIILFSKHLLSYYYAPYNILDTENVAIYGSSSHLPLAYSTSAPTSPKLDDGCQGGKICRGLIQSLLPDLGSEGVMGYRTFSSFGQQSLRTSCGKNLSHQIPAEIEASAGAAGLLGPGPGTALWDPDVRKQKWAEQHLPLLLMKTAQISVLVPELPSSEAWASS